MPAKAYNRIGRLNGSDAGRMARPLWVCDVCRCFHTQRDRDGKLIKPFTCLSCGRTAFSYFHSEGEAQCWAALHLRQRAGDIRNLRRQVNFDLLTVGKAGLPCVWATANLDFTFEELQDDATWLPVCADFKPLAGISNDAALKFRCLEAMGFPVRILTKNGEI